MHPAKLIRLDLWSDPLERRSTDGLSGTPTMSRVGAALIMSMLPRVGGGADEKNSELTRWRTPDGELPEIEKVRIAKKAMRMR